MHSAQKKLLQSRSLRINTLRQSSRMHQYCEDHIEQGWNLCLSLPPSCFITEFQRCLMHVAMLSAHVVNILIYLLFLDSQQVLCIFFLLMPALLLNKIIAQENGQHLWRLGTTKQKGITSKEPAHTSSKFMPQQRH